MLHYSDSSSQLLFYSHNQIYFIYCTWRHFHNILLMLAHSGTYMETLTNEERTVKFKVCELRDLPLLMV